MKPINIIQKLNEKHMFESSDSGSEDWKCFEHHKNEFKDYYELPNGILFRDKNKPMYGVIMDGKFLLDAVPIPKDGKYRTDNSTLDTIELKDEDFSPVEDFITYYIPSDYKYDAVADGRCPYCDKELTTNDEFTIKKYGMCRDCYDNGVE